MASTPNSFAKAVTKHIYLFGDQAIDVSVELTKILSTQQGPTTNAFIERSLQHLRVGVNSLHHVHRTRIPRFSDFRDLLVEKDAGRLHPALDQALACVYHLASFIAYIEREQKPYPTPDETILVGLCTGSIAAAAISACQTLSELLPVATHAVQVAFYTGVCAATCGDALYPPPAEQRLAHWSLLIPNLAFAEASLLLQDFAKHEGLSKTSTPWISASTERSVTISGPPDKLGAFSRSETFLSRRPAVTPALLPIFAPYHASSIFNERSVESVLEQAGTLRLREYGSEIPVIATYDRDSSWGDDLPSVMRTAVASILRSPMQWEKTMETVASHVRISSPEYVKIISIGTKSGQALRTHISKLDQVQHVDVEQLTVPLAASEATSGPKQEKIAIIGMSGRFPEADDCDEFWDILSQGLDVHKPVPDLHWGKTHVDTTGTKKNTSATPFGCWLKSPGMFDAKFFHMSPREAPQVDPYDLRSLCTGRIAQRLALLTAYEALEDAGLTPESTPSTQKDRVGVFYGVTSNDWMETNSAQNIDTYFIPGGNRAFIPGRVNYFFKFSGPSYSIDTACSSSLAAIHLACNALWRREIDTAITGGTNVLTNPDFTSGLDRGHFLSRTGNCKTFDDSADGYCRGEGVVTFVMKRLEDAIADNDPVKAVILGAYTNHSAEADSITRPHVGAQKQIFQNVLHDAGIRSADISYVEMHGTGTQAGDAGEMQSVLETFAPPEGGRKRQSSQRLHIGSAKANIGHQEAASGATSLAKVLLMMKHSVIPPHCGIKTKINRKFPKDMNDRQVFIADKSTPWVRGTGETRRAFVNNFSAAGGNSALVVEDAPILDRKETDMRTMFPICVSAKTASALAKNLKALESYLDESANEDGLLANISYTTTARRVHHPHRALVVAADIAGLKKGLGNAIEQKTGATRSKSAPKVVFAFTGQGSQYFGMGKELYTTFTSFRQDLEQFDHISQSHGFPSFLSVITETSGNLTSTSPTKTQLALTCLQIALARLWKSWHIEPSLVVGHSLGEYAALCIAGVLSVSDTIYLVGSRAQLLETSCTKYSHSMLAVRASVEQLKQIINDESVEVACINGPSDTVLSGNQNQIKSVERRLQEAGIKSTLLKVPFAFHSAQVDPILDAFHKVASSVRFKEPAVTVLSPVRGKAEKVFDADYLRDHCRQTVDFVQVINAVEQERSLLKDHIVLEIGPKPVVSSMFKAILGSSINTLPSLGQGQDPWKLTAQALTSFYQSGHTINWVEYNRDFKHRVVELPHYGWDLQHYWIDYVNDWSLRKGDPLPAASALPTRIDQTQTVQKPIDPEMEMSTTVHKATTYTKLKETGQVVVESDISRSDLSQIVRGHEVDGFPLCTPSVYADIALSIGKYLAQAYKIPLDTKATAVTDMNITRALIAKYKGPQILRTTATYNTKTNVACCKFESISDTGAVVGEHATCIIRFCDKTIENADPAETRLKIDLLRQGLPDYKTYRFNRSMIYKCVGALANFDPNYRGLASITMDSDNLEACSVVEFSNISEKGNYHTHPGVIDALSQVGGFVMNCNDQSDVTKEVFVNHGWGAFHMVEPLSITEKYQAHVKMRETPNKLWKGDITILKGEDVVAKFCDIALQAVPRRLLKYVLSTDGTKSAVHNAESAAPSREKSEEVPKNAAPENKASQPVQMQFQVNQGKQKGQQAVQMQSQSSQSIQSSQQASQPVQMQVQVNQSNQQSLGKLSTKLMDILSEESGIASEELVDDLIFSELGVDSLLSLLIISRINDELHIAIDQGKFAEMSTVGDIKAYISQSLGSSSTAAPGPPETAQYTAATKPAETAPVESRNERPHLFQTDSSDSDDVGPDGYAKNSPKPRLSDGAISTPASVADSEITRVSTPEIELLTPKDSSTFPRKGSYDKAEKQPAPPASSVILQGRPQTAEKILFLLPDGSGSAHSYIDIPNIRSKLAVIGLNSPFRGDAASMKYCSLDSLIVSYIAEIRRRQPHGPYHFGGWSAGGILAYCITQALIGEGEEVANLLLIDSPEPKGLDHLPQRFYDHCATTGVFGAKEPGLQDNSGPPDWLMAHFEATIDLLHDYWAEPLIEGCTPKTSLIWAADCVFDGVKFEALPASESDSLEEGEAVKFLTEKRTDFSAGHWAHLFPGGEVSVQVGKGAHHFSLMHEKAHVLANFIDKSLFA